MNKRFLQIVSVFLLLMMLVSAFSVSAAKTDNYPNTHINTGDQRVDIVSVARTQLGYMEGENNDTKYGTWYGLPNQPWCAMFVSWCARQAGVPTDILRNCAIAAPDPGYFDITYYDGEEYTPKPGDLFFTKTFSHVGLVESVNGDYFCTLEGNTNDTGSSMGIGVFNLRRVTKDYYFGVPDYNYASKNHTCDKDIFVKYGEDHPHTAVYRCSVCSKTIEDSSVVTRVDGCFYCNAPEKPVMQAYNDPFFGENAVTFHWEESADATYYDFALEQSDGHGKWQEYETVQGALSGFTWMLPQGRYRAKLTAYNTRFRNEDYPEGLSAASDYKEFSLGKVLYTISFDENTELASMQVQTKQQGLDCVISAAEPERDGFVFLGWATYSGAKTPEYLSGDYYKDDASVVLYAVWRDANATARLGDANEDEVVNIKDATAIQKHLAGITILTQTGLTVADADTSGDVNIKDATAIQKYLAEMPTDFPIGDYYG